MPSQHRSGRQAGEWRLAGQHLVEHAGQTVEVAPPVHLSLSGGLLRAHIGRRAEREAGLGESLSPGCVHRSRNAEISDHRLLSLEQDVLRLDVPVDDSLPVRVRERRRDVLTDPERRSHRQLFLAHQALAQRFALDEGHRVPELSSALSRVEDRQNVRVLQPRGDADFLEEPGGPMVAASSG